MLLFWKQFPKDVYATRNMIKIGVVSSVLEFNNCTQGVRKIYENAGFHFSWFITAPCKVKDKNRISIMIHKSSDSVKKRKIKLGAIRKWFYDKEKEEEGGESCVSRSY